MMKKIIELSSLEKTQKLAHAVGLLLQGGECIEFVSDLGGGKTTFIKALVLGAGSTDVVSSPTFTISKIYNSTNFRFYHFDFYRLSEPGLVSEELAEALDDKQGVVVVEWAQSVQNVLPDERIVIEISKSAQKIDERIMTVTVPNKFEHVWSALS